MDENSRYIEVLKGLQNSAKHSTSKEMESNLIMMFLIVILILLLAVLIYNLPKIRRKLWDINVYNFMFTFKELTESEKRAIEYIGKKYKVENKYRIMISEAEYDKYINRERISIEESSIPILEKEKKINLYVKLKEKIFFTNN